MSDRIESVIADLDTATADADEKFGGLSKVQLNWKPAEKSWSVAQCLDHLITINSLYFPLFEKLRSGSVAATFWEKYSPLSGFFGRYLIKVLGPEYGKKVKTSKKAFPSSSEIGGDIVKRFGEHQAQLADRIRGIPAEIDLRSRIITSPLAGFVTYSLDDCLTILTVHERRHLEQARRVTEANGFPA